MNHETMEERVRQALDAELSGLRTTPGERDRMYANVTGGTKVKRKLTMGLVLAIVLVLITAAAIAAAPIAAAVTADFMALSAIPISEV